MLRPPSRVSIFAHLSSMMNLQHFMLELPTEVISYVDKARHQSENLPMPQFA